jgi:hypothetical protein
MKGKINRKLKYPQFLLFVRPLFARCAHKMEQFFVFLSGKTNIPPTGQRGEMREVSVPMRIISLDLWIGEKMKRSRTRVLMVFQKSKRYRRRPLFAVPACKISHLHTFGTYKNHRIFVPRRGNKDLSVFTVLYVITLQNSGFACISLPFLGFPRCQAAVPHS